LLAEKRQGAITLAILFWVFIRQKCVNLPSCDHVDSMVAKNVDGKRDHFPFSEVSGGRSQSARMRVAANSKWATTPGLFFPYTPLLRYFLMQ
jgi:hypothetical protein